MDEERKDACIWMVLSTLAVGEGWRVHIEVVECAHGRDGVCVHGERKGVCIWKGSSVHTWGRGSVCGRVCVHGER